MHYGDYQTILSAQNHMNLYRGCTHGCIYCDSRSACYGMTHAFEDVEVKRNAPLMVERELRAKRAPCMIGTGSMCDPYLPLEKELQYTRACLHSLRRYGFGLSVLTKSTLILRDAELLKEINERSKCVAQMTLTTYDEKLCRKLEPNVSSTEERFCALRRFRDEGVPTVVWLTPTLPMINDTEQNLRGLMRYCLEAGVRGIVCFGFGLTLREGNREYFYQKLDELFPGLKQEYLRRFGGAYECNSPNHDRLMRIWTDTCERYGVLHRTEEVFAYLRQYESRLQQTTMF